MTTQVTYDFDDNTTQNLGTWFGLASIAADAGSAKDGGYGLLITPNEGFWGVQSTNYPGFAVVGAPAAISTSYSIWMKASASGVGNARIEIEWHDVGGTYTTTTTLEMVTSGNQVPTTWTQYTGSLSIPAGSYNGFVIIGGDSWTAGTVSVDTLIFGDIAVPIGPQIWDGSAWVPANQDILQAKVRGSGVWL